MSSIDDLLEDLAENLIANLEEELHSGRETFEDSEFKNFEKPKYDKTEKVVGYTSNKIPSIEYGEDEKNLTSARFVKKALVKTANV